MPDHDYVRLPRAEFEALMERAAERGARRALTEIGLDNSEGEAAKDVRELRSLLDAIRVAREVAWKTVVRVVTTTLLLALVAGLALRKSLFGG